MQLTPKATKASGNGCTEESDAREWNTKDFWEFDELKNKVTRHHVTPRDHLFNPVGTSCPVELKRLAAQRYTVATFKDGEVDLDITWGWEHERARALKSTWTGKTIFRIPLANEVDYGLEAREVRHAISDTSYLGAEREGVADIHVIGSGPFEVIFLEDNQATIRIMESGRSP